MKQRKCLIFLNTESTPSKRYNCQGMNSSRDISYNTKSQVSSSLSASSPSWNRDHYVSRRESAIFVDWDPVPEVQRRVDLGIEYEHWPERQKMDYQKGYQKKRVIANVISDDNVEIVPSAIASLRVTKEERERLKSAHPEE